MGILSIERDRNYKLDIYAFVAGKWKCFDRVRYFVYIINSGSFHVLGWLLSCVSLFCKKKNKKLKWKMCCLFLIIFFSTWQTHKCCNVLFSVFFLRKKFLNRAAKIRNTYAKVEIATACRSGVILLNLSDTFAWRA